MRKLLCSLALCATTSIASAQGISGNPAYFELEPVFGNGQAAMTIRLGKNWSVNEYTMVGFGVGVSEDLRFNNLEPAIPITFRGTFDNHSKDVSPFLSMDLGYCVNTAAFDMGSVVLNPTLGVRVKGAYFGVGYFGSLPTVSGAKLSSNVNVRLGFYMGHSSGMSWFFKNTFVTAELGAGVSTSKYDGPSRVRGDREANDNSNKGADLTFNWLYKINENIAAGLGTGCRFNYHDDGGGQVAVPLYVRAQYAVGSEGNAIRPFAAVNVGMMNYTGSEEDCGSNFYFEPQVGVWLNDRVSLSVGYDPTARFNYEEDRWSEEGYKHNYSQATVRLGVRF